MRNAKQTLIHDEHWPARGGEGEIAKLVKERLIGTSRWAQAARAAVAAHARHDNPLLIEGEPGTGKEFVAGLIHACSARSDGPFVTFSCEGVSQMSVEAALFGSLRVLASGQHRSQRGMVEAAKGGTLYISGVSQVSSMVAVKVARLAQHQEFCRLEDAAIEAADVRVVLGDVPPTAADQQARGSEEGSALGVRDVLKLAPLRRRKADIGPLSQYFVNQCCQRMGKERRELSAEVRRRLRGHEWPGNVSELKQVIAYMVGQSPPPSLTPDLLPSYLLSRAGIEVYELSASGIDLSQEIKQFELSLVCAALERCQGVQAKAAQLLGLKLSTLNAKIARYGIDVRSFK